MRLRRGVLAKAYLLLIIPGLVLAGLVALLISKNYLSQVELQKFALRNLQHGLEKHAAAVSYFYAERENDLKNPVSLRGSETILLVEDEELVREVTSRILEGYGHTVLQAQDGLEALRLAEDCGGSLHLLLTDVTMPGMSGRELAEHLVSRYPRLKVLYMSGYTEFALGGHRILDQAINFLQKPFKHLEIALKIREVLDRPGRRRNPRESSTSPRHVSEARARQS